MCFCDTIRIPFRCHFLAEDGEDFFGKKKKQGERIVKKNFSLTISLCSFKTRKGDEEKG